MAQPSPAAIHQNIRNFLVRLSFSPFLMLSEMNLSCRVSRVSLTRGACSDRDYANFEPCSGERNVHCRYPGFHPGHSGSRTVVAA